jgi:hypothetical protein
MITLAPVIQDGTSSHPYRGYRTVKKAGRKGNLLPLRKRRMKRRVKRYVCQMANPAPGGRVPEY